MVIRKIFLFIILYRDTLIKQRQNISENIGIIKKIRK